VVSEKCATVFFILRYRPDFLMGYSFICPSDKSRIKNLIRVANSTWDWIARYLFVIWTLKSYCQALKASLTRAVVALRLDFAVELNIADRHSNTKR
jgi:hypothetical protein